MALTKTEKIYIRKSVAAGVSPAKIARRLGKSLAATHKAIQRYAGSARAKPAPKAWSRFETRWLERNYPTAAWPEIRKALPKRSVIAIRAKAEKLCIGRGGVKQGQEYNYSMDLDGEAAPPKIRACLCCRASFKSHGPGNRLCDRCKNSDYARGISDVSFAN